jgi:tetratricopeptide (TPR) repeat protein
VTLNEAQQGLNAAQQQPVIRRIVEELLASLPPPVADAVRLGAIPHWFDPQLLDRLCSGELDVAQVMPYLQRFRFVRQDAQGHFRYHDKVRDDLLAWWREEHPHQYEVANRSALAYFSALAEAANSIERPLYEREVLYHLLIVDETAGLQYLAEWFEDACARYQLGLAEGFVAQAAQLKNILADKGRLWVRYFEARLDLVYRRDDKGQATFKDLADRAPDPVLQAVARWSLGEIRVNQQRWSEAVRLYSASLGSLQREGALMYSARLMLALGHAYRHLADSSGGFHAESDQLLGAASRFLYILQHLPFLIYEGLVHRLNFLPNWFFGTNYQDWIIAYLLIEATRWYRRAERQLREIGDTQGLAGARLSLGELEHQLGRWSRTRRRYAILLETDQIKGSLYRTARVRLGQGRAFLDEGSLIKADTALSEALETFRRFRDDSSVGVTAALLGRVYATLGRLDEALSAYVESARAFGAVEDHLARTRVVWALEDLAQRHTLPGEQKQQFDTVAAQVTEQHYITRFPDTLLHWFRRLALWGALPLTYVLTFVISLALTLSLVIIEGEFGLWQIGADVQTTVTDALILIVFATLPVLLALWLYRLIYSLMGMTVVRFLGRRLIPIERDQPSHFVSDATGLTYHDVSKGLSRTVAWSDVSLLVSVDYCQWRQPIHLISSTILAASSGMMVMVDAITAGYKYLKQDIARHLGRQREATQQQNLDFVIFDGRWTLASIAISLVFALYLVYMVPVNVTYIVEPSGQQVTLLLSSIMVSFVPTLLLVFPVVVLWRLVSHQIAVRDTLTYQAEIISLRALWLAATVSTVTAALWIILLATMF